MVGGNYGTELWRSETVYDQQTGRVTRSIGAHAPGEEGPATDYEYDTLGRQIATIGPAVYDPLANEDVRHRSESHYDDQARLQESWDNIRVVVNPDGTKEPPDYADKHVTAYDYDAYGRRVKTTFDDATFTETGYDDFGRTVSETNQAGVTRNFEYDAAGRLTAVILPEVQHPDAGIDMVRPRYEYTYDAQGNHVGIRDNVYQVGSQIYYDHDGTAGDFSQDYDTRVTQFTYDSQGRQLTRTLPEGQVEEKRYDDLGRLSVEISFEGVVTAHEYDDSAGAGGRLAAKRYFVDEAAYDAWAAEPQNVLPDQITTYAYDALGRRTEILQDRDGDLSTTEDQRVETTSYDAHGRTESIATDEGTIHYEYDTVTGQIARTYTGLADPEKDSISDDGKAVTDTRYAYDALGRLDTVTVVERFDEPLATPEVTDYVYDLLGNLGQVRLPNDVISEYDYDDLNRLELLTQFRDENSNGVYDVGVDALLAEYDYDLLPDGRRSGVTETDHEANTTRIDWLYDNLGRLSREKYDSYDPALDFITDYEFDLVGNRLAKKTDTDPTFTGDPTFDETVNYTYDDNDRLLTETKDAPGTDDDRHTVYAYDATQQTLKTVYEGLDDTGTKLEETAYTYNFRGRMSTVTIDCDGNQVPETQLEYEYDDSGIRVAQTKTIDGNGDGDFDDPEDTSERTEYLIDPFNPTGYAQVLEEWVDAALAKSYTLGLDVIAQALASGAVHFFLYDGHGSTRALVDPTGQPLSGEIYRYDAYGNPIGFDPATALTTLLYSGEQLDQLTGLQYLRARYYDLATGRFNRLDPFFGNLRDPQSLHKYLYTYGNPIDGIDPSGLCFSLNTQMVVASVRAVLFVYNIYAAVRNAVTGGVFAIHAVNDFRNYRPISGIVNVVKAVFFGGLAALSVIGIKSFLSNPPTFSGGLSLGVSASGHAYLQWQAIVVRNPAFARWVTQEALPAIFVVFATGWVDNPDRSPLQDRRLSDGEIRKLKKKNVDPEELKDHTAERDLFKDDKGNIYVKPKDGSGPGDPTGLNINDF